MKTPRDTLLRVCFIATGYHTRMAPGIFQRATENLLEGTVIVYIDDILITTEHHLKSLDEVLSQLGLLLPNHA
jgi:hypothetical protein